MIRHVVHCRPVVAQPLDPREQRRIRQSADEADFVDRFASYRWRCERRLGGCQNSGAGSLATAQVAVGDEVFVCVDDHAARDAEIACQRS